MKPDDFVDLYEAALATQTWAAVAPLINDDACVTFSSGSVHRGKAAVRGAFESNFRTIKDETYAISNLHWVRKDGAYAVYLFEFDWAGLIGGEPAKGGGTGTCVLIKEGEKWQLLAEHLGPRA